jgi:hypothetical protein
VSVMASPQIRSFATVPLLPPECTATGIRRGRARALSESEEAQWRQASLQRARSRSTLHRAVLALSWLLMRLESHMEARLQKRLALQSPLSNEPESNGLVPPAPRTNRSPNDHANAPVFIGDAPRKGWTAESAGVPVTDSVEIAGVALGVDGLVRDIGPSIASYLFQRRLLTNVSIAVTSQSSLQ